jgi:hypothetical protein
MTAPNDTLNLKVAQFSINKEEHPNENSPCKQN